MISGEREEERNVPHRGSEADSWLTARHSCLSPRQGGAVFAVTSSTSRSPQEQALHTEPASGAWLHEMAPFFQAKMTGRKSG